MHGDVKNFGDKKNTAGFDKNPENINKEGRPLSIRKTLKEMLGKDGEYFIPKEQIVKINDEGVTIAVPDDVMIVLKLMEWAKSKKGYDSLKAIQMIIEHVDGKPNQAIEIDPSTDGVITVIQLPDNGRD